MNPCEKCKRNILQPLDDPLGKRECEYCAHPQMPNSIIASIRRRAFREAANEVSSHWNDHSHTTNQHQQAQRSAAALLKIAGKEKK